MTGVQLVQSIWPGLTDEIADYILWHCTAFPFSDFDHLKAQIEQVYQDSGGDVQKAIDDVDAEMERGFEEYQHKMEAKP